MPKLKLSEEEAVWNWEATRIMFKLINEYPEWTADDFFREARKLEMPPAQIAKNVAGMFKSFQASGYIQKTDRFRLSQRNDSSALPIWVKRGKVTEMVTEKDAF